MDLQGQTRAGNGGRPHATAAPIVRFDAIAAILTALTIGSPA